MPTRDPNKLMADIAGLLDTALLNAAKTGAGARTLVEIGARAEALRALDGSEASVDAHIAFVERFEALIREGQRLDQTLLALRREGWMERLATFVLPGVAQ